MTTEQLDVTEQQSLEDAAHRIDSAHSRLDVLVNNAGIVSVANPPTADALRRVLDTNVVGALGTTEALLPLLKSPPRRASSLSVPAWGLLRTPRTQTRLTTAPAPLSIGSAWPR